MAVILSASYTTAVGWSGDLFSLQSHGLLLLRLSGCSIPQGGNCDPEKVVTCARSCTATEVQDVNPGVLASREHYLCLQDPCRYLQEADTLSQRTVVSEHTSALCEDSDGRWQAGRPLGKGGDEWREAAAPLCASHTFL